MSDTKISEAAVEAALQSCIPQGGGSWRDLYSLDEQAEHMENMREALEAAIPHLHPQLAELAEQQGVRELFEAWARKFGHDLTRRSIGREGDDSYSDDFALYAWTAWQAALAATGKQQVGEVQAVDLQQFRPMVQMYIEANEKIEHLSDVAAWAVGHGKRLLAKIDGRDAAPGVE